MSCGRCLRCGIPLQRAAMCAGLVDVFLGVISTSILGSYLTELSTKFTPTRDQTIRYYCTLTMLIACSIQAVVGFALFHGAVHKSRIVCLLWILIAGLTTPLMWSFPIRIYQLLIVCMFARELRKVKQDLSQTRKLSYQETDLKRIPQPQEQQQSTPNIIVRQQQPMDSKTGQLQQQKINQGGANNNKNVGYPKVYSPGRQQKPVVIDIVQKGVAVKQKSITNSG